MATRPSIRSALSLSGLFWPGAVSFPGDIEVGDLLVIIVVTTEPELPMNLPAGWSVNRLASEGYQAYFLSKKATNIDVYNLSLAATFDVAPTTFMSLAIAVKNIGPAALLTTSFQLDLAIAVIETSSLAVALRSFTLFVAAKANTNAASTLIIPSSFDEFLGTVGGNQQIPDDNVFTVSIGSRDEVNPGQLAVDVLAGSKPGDIFTIILNIDAYLANLCAVQARVMGTDGLPKAGQVLTVAPLRTGVAEVDDVLVVNEAISKSSDGSGFVECKVIRSDELLVVDGDSPNYNISLDTIGLIEADIGLDVAVYDLGVVFVGS
jgi:hypothetical protein